ncbi:hypothetical protein DNTS_020372, partial [Danionella cerebrum]
MRGGLSITSCTDPSSEARSPADCLDTASSRFAEENNLILRE